ncbi:serine protease DegQ [Sphingomonas naasensis]|uniref:Trypsin-like serine protease n=1 Tax=Sphingomonas naasensis TaxID=1344951 RepID=A0A4S1WV18_9SPHN|nr:trypsin-like peptidase domain-containing protein [Sphingomonas naasensis]NIJ19024.1 serine protease DegQ [Sphingomonas naasensis]TGX46227.1 trypsin-like serine protease [Sphingomonas naasensis]
MRDARKSAPLIGPVLLAAALLGACRSQPNDRGQPLPTPTATPGAPAQTSGARPGGTTGFAELVARAAPAVVSIAVVQASPAQQNPLLRDPFFRRYFDVPDAGQVRLSSGSGVIVDSARGLVLTNHHVVADARTIEVVLPDQRRFEATRLGSDAPSDIALLRLPAANLPQLPLGNSDAARVGDQVLAIGNPFGLGQTVTSGIISAVGRGLSREGFESYIQTDASINPGNSGGPLIGMGGTVVGINSALFGPGANIGIGFAVPANTARFVMNEILRHGTVHRGRLGVTLLDAATLAGANADTPVRGALIAAVAPGSAAERAGLRRGDIVVSAGERETPTAAALRDLVGRTEVGTQLVLRVRRGSNTLDLTVPVEG